MYALSELGFIGSHGNEETKPAAVVSKEQATVVPKPRVADTSDQPVDVAPRTPMEQTTDGWAIIGFYQQGNFSDLTLMVHGDSPAIGRSYNAVEDFRLVQERPERGQATITLGMVHRGDSVEVLDIEIEPGTRRVPVWAKLRAVLHHIERPSR